MVAIIGITANLEDSQAAGLVQCLRGALGVTSVRHAERIPHLLLLDYDEKRTSRTEILRHLDKDGWGAKVAGC